MPRPIAPPIRRRAALAGAAVVLGMALAGCGITVRKTSGPSRYTPQELVDDGEFSTLDGLGIARIEASKSLRLDFRKGSIAKSDVGLPDSEYGPDLPAPKGTKFQLSIEGPSGTLEAETDHVRFNTTDTMPTLDIVYYFLTAGSLEDYVGLLRDGVSKYGMDASAVETWIENTKADPRGNDNYALAPGNALGFDVVYDLRYDGSKDIQVIIVSVSAVE